MYYVYDIVSGDEVLYVGFTTNPKGRMSQHRTSANFPDDAAMLVVSEWSTEEDARDAEYKRIGKLRPPYNSQGMGIYESSKLGAGRIRHPGVILRDDFFIPTDESAYSLGKRFGVPASTFNEIVRGRRGVTVYTARLLEIAFEPSVRWWLDVQAEWDLAAAGWTASEVFAPSKQEAAILALDPAPPPGDVIFDWFLAPRGMLASRLNYESDQWLGDAARAIRRGTQGISPKLALGYAKVFGTDPRFWMSVQVRHDIVKEGAKPFRLAIQKRLEQDGSKIKRAASAG